MSTNDTSTTKRTPAIAFAERVASRYELDYNERARIAQELVRLDKENKALRAATASPESENLMLDFAASQSCESHTGRKWLDLDNEEKSFWRNEAKTQAKEWAAETAHYAKKRRIKSEDSPEP